MERKPSIKLMILLRLQDMAERQSHANSQSVRVRKGRHHDAKITVLTSCCEGRHAQPETGSLADFAADLWNAAAQGHDALQVVRPSPVWPESENVLSRHN